MKAEIRVLYDGWALVDQPLSSPAIHLWEILTQLPGTVRAVLALPADPPPWLPANIEVQVCATAKTPAGQLRWEQRTLPRLAHQVRADLLHLTHSHAPLFASLPVVVSPTEYAGRQSGLAGPGLAARWRAALVAGARARPHTTLWPLDLPAPARPGPVIRFPFPAAPQVDRDQRQEPALPETFVLYHGPCDPDSLVHLMDVWSWANAPLGEDYPLVLLGLPPARRAWLENWLAGQGLQTYLYIPEALSPSDISLVYQRSSLLLHPAALTPWGDPLQRALSAGRPIVAAESDWADARVGPAAYLVPADDARGLGAACLTLIAQENVAAELAAAARQRSAGWEKQSYAAALEQLYRGLLV
ncbi:MAG: glycosyltransferase [Anaerolineales bacterium]|nr:glycosyltransferase [Anaerolineales bacterium]